MRLSLKELKKIVSKMKDIQESMEPMLINPDRFRLMIEDDIDSTRQIMYLFFSCCDFEKVEYAVRVFKDHGFKLDIDSVKTEIEIKYQDPDPSICLSYPRPERPKVILRYLSVNASVYLK